MANITGRTGDVFGYTGIIERYRAYSFDVEADLNDDASQSVSSLLKAASR